MDKSYQAIVEKIIREGRHGPYAVATPKDLDCSVTFSLNKDVWENDDMPEQGTIVVLSGLMRKRAGWRAKHGRLLMPSEKYE